MELPVKTSGYSFIQNRTTVGSTGSSRTKTKCYAAFAVDAANTRLKHGCTLRKTKASPLCFIVCMLGKSFEQKGVKFALVQISALVRTHYCSLKQARPEVAHDVIPLALAGVMADIGAAKACVCQTMICLNAISGISSAIGDVRRWRAAAFLSALEPQMANQCAA